TTETTLIFTSQHFQRRRAQFHLAAPATPQSDLTRELLTTRRTLLRSIDNRQNLREYVGPVHCRDNSFNSSSLSFSRTRLPRASLASQSVLTSESKSSRLNNKSSTLS